jgi:hypothetical protein
MKLLSEEDIKLLSKVIKPQVEQEKIKLNYYLFLKKYADDILTSDIEVSIEDLLYSQYLWLTKYRNRYVSIGGYDAGVEQQVFNLAEEIDQQLEAGIDWSIIEKIENEPG